MNETLREKYLQTVNKLIRLRRSHRDLRNREEKRKNQLEYLQARITDAVCTEKDENGKLMYSNDIHRRTADTVRLYGDPEYRRIAGELEAIQQYMAQASDRYFFAKRKEEFAHIGSGGREIPMSALLRTEGYGGAQRHRGAPRSLYRLHVGINAIRSGYPCGCTIKSLTFRPQTV